jgi:hypothetical protein
MFEHLITPTIFDEPPEYTRVDSVTPQQVLDAQIKTADFLESIGAASDEEVEENASKKNAQLAFTAMAAGAPAEKVKQQLMANTTPEAVRRLVGMLTAYDWAFVEQARQMRGYAVAKILEDTEHPDPRYRLKALEMLGKVTEVALFTERVEVKKTELTDEEIEAKIKAKLGKYMGAIEVEAQEKTHESK